VELIQELEEGYTRKIKRKRKSVKRRNYYNETSEENLMTIIIFN